MSDEKRAASIVWLTQQIEVAEAAIPQQEAKVAKFKEHVAAAEVGLQRAKDKVAELRAELAAITPVSPVGEAGAAALDASVKVG